MTDGTIALRAFFGEGSDAVFLRYMIGLGLAKPNDVHGFVAERLMSLETESLCSVASANASRTAATSATASLIATGRSAPARPN
jgi:hypothetical protein